MKRKVKRYDGEEGSEVESDDSGSSKDYGIDYSESTNPGGSLEDYKPAKSQSFKEAFAAGRAAALAGGPKTFTWNGKTYGTELAKPKAASKSTPKEEPKSKSTAKEEPKSEYKTEFQRQQERAGEGSEAFGRVMSRMGDKIKSAISPSKSESRGSGRIDTSNIDKKTLLSRKDMAKGGTASSRADGCAQRGHTRGKYL
jgi:hypothetical protein